MIQNARPGGGVPVRDGHEPPPTTVPGPRPQQPLARAKIECAQSDSDPSRIMHNHPSLEPTERWAIVDDDQPKIIITAALQQNASDHVSDGS
ncbi:MAG: hypothetical protein JO141_11965 [Bradyrhizobium sp.]|nr:hypothetical protein [Bradyrhizobium sp.]